MVYNGVRLSRKGVSVGYHEFLFLYHPEMVKKHLSDPLALEDRERVSKAVKWFETQWAQVLKQ